MSRLAFSETALADLRQIWLFTARTWGEAKADSYTDDLEAACTDLAEGLKQGRPVAERPGTLRYTIARHLIFFRAGEGGITVIRILHQRMNVERWLDDGEL